MYIINIILEEEENAVSAIVTHLSSFNEKKPLFANQIWLSKLWKF